MKRCKKMRVCVCVLCVLCKSESMHTHPLSCNLTTHAALLGGPNRLGMTVMEDGTAWGTTRRIPYYLTTVGTKVPMILERRRLANPPVDKTPFPLPLQSL